MKFRCPYCKQIIEGAPQVTCPHCNRAMNIPDRFLSLSARDRKRIKDRIARDAERERRALGAPDFRFGREPSSVILILAVMAVVGGMLLSRSRRTAPTERMEPPENVAGRELDVLRIAVEQFRQDCGRYPEMEEGIRALRLDPGVVGWQGPYITVIKADPWERPYVYRLADGELTLRSLGRDGLEGTPDDIVPAEPGPDDLIRAEPAEGENGSGIAVTIGDKP
jgi:general secretion pathway protein G